MKFRALGFTLVEVIAVLVILGVLVSTALPRLVSLSDVSREEIVSDIASSLTTAASVNHANNIAFDAGLSMTRPVTVTSCRGALELMEGELNGKYHIVGGQGTSVEQGGVGTEGGVSSCRIAYDSNGNGDYNATDEPQAFFTVYGVL